MVASIEVNTFHTSFDTLDPYSSSAFADPYLRSQVRGAKIMIVIFPSFENESELIEQMLF